MQFIKVMLVSCVLYLILVSSIDVLGLGYTDEIKPPSQIITDIDKTRCGKYAIHEDEARIKIAQLTSSAQLYSKMLEVQVIKMDITIAHATLDDSMGVTENDNVLKAAAQDIIDETTRLTELYSAVIFEIELKVGVKDVINDQYIKSCGDYVTTTDDLHHACITYSELDNAINCRVLRYTRQTKDV